MKSFGKTIHAATLTSYQSSVVLIYFPLKCWLAYFLAEPLSKLLANSLTTTVVPTDWRLAIICPINKKRESRGRFQLPPRESHFYNI